MPLSMITKTKYGSIIVFVLFFFPVFVVVVVVVYQYKRFGCRFAN